MGEGMISDVIKQYGFAGLCAALLAILTWMVRRFMDLLEKNSNVIGANTAAIERLARDFERSEESFSSLRDRLLSRPCLSLRSERSALFNRKETKDV